MANEITATINLTVSNGNFVESYSPTMTIDQTVAGGGNPGTITAALAPSETTVTLTDMTSPGYCLMKNLSTLYSMTFGPDSTGLVDFGKIGPGEIALFRLDPAATFKIQTDTGGVASEVQIMVFED